jgi:putative transposon-encoded protein
MSDMVEPVEDLPSELKVTGFEMIEREVKRTGNTGRVYLPKIWIGTTVKIIRVSKRKEVSQETEE